MSCGSGLFTRRFAASGRFKGVIASDYSVGMLGQTSSFIAQDAAVDPKCVGLQQLIPEWLSAWPRSQPSWNTVVHRWLLCSHLTLLSEKHRLKANV